VLELQQGYAKEAYEAFVGQLNRLSDIMTSTAKEAYKPFETKLAGTTTKSGK
jgi:hypothetical protein